MSTGSEPSGRIRRWQEELTVAGEQLVSRIEELIKAGNVRRVIVKHEGRTLVEVPLSLGVVGALLAPQVAALGALAALVTNCSVTIEREEGSDADAGGAATDSTDQGAPAGQLPSPKKEVDLDSIPKGNLPSD